MKKILLFNLILLPFISFGQASLVKDIDPNFGTNGNGIPTYGNNRISFDNKLIFGASNGTGSGYNATELWVSDGTESGTVMIKDIWPSVGSGNPRNFIIWQNEVVFIGDEGGAQMARKNLYRSDLTEFGTTNMSNLNFYTAPFIFNDNLYIGRENIYWAQNIGNTLSYAPFAFLLPNTSETNSTAFLGVLNNKLFFKHPATSGFGNELWATDGTSSGTSLIKDINTGNDASDVSNFTIFNNKAYFSADDGVNGRELWVTDGTVAGTYMVLDLYSGTTGSNPTNLIVYNNALYFTANHPTLGLEIFKMTTLENITNLKNINPGSGNSAPFGFTEYNGKLYFAADDGTNGVELWSTTGFSSTTNMLKDINTTGESTPLYFTEYFGKLYFNADDGVNGRELWSTDGTAAGTVLVQNINPGSMDSSPSDLIVSNDVLFFSANDGTHGLELWKYVDPALSIQDVALNNKTNLFPNPVSFDFSIETTADIESLSIYSIQGKLIKTFDLNQATYNVEELSAGMYLLNIQTTEGFVTKKLIKE